MKVIAKIPLFVLYILCAIVSHAQKPAMTDTVHHIGIPLYFMPGESRIDPSYRGNAERMAQFEREVSMLTADPSGRVRTVAITTGSSPEGNSALNMELSDLRATFVKDYVASLMPMSRGKISAVSKGIDWERMKALVLASDMPSRHAVADIIDRTPVWVVKDGKVVDGRKRRLMMLDGGKAWHYMVEHIFPELRGSYVDVACEFIKPHKPVTPDTIIVTDTVTVVLRDTITAATASARHDTVTTVSHRGGYPIGIGTNLLFDALFIPNLSLEFPIGTNWWAGINGMYGWTEHDASRIVYAYGGEAHLRYRINPDPRPLSGHHLGVYAQMLRYNIKHSGRGYLSDRWSYGAGFEYGYSIPLGSRFRFGLAVGIGYLTGTYREYIRQDGCDVWQATKRLQWIGPAKAEITFMWIPFAANSKKGGQR